MVEVYRYQRQRVVSQNTLQLPVGGFLEDCVDFIDRGVAPGDERQIDQRDVDGRHADRETVQLAVQFRQHEADRRRGAGLGRDHAVGGRTRAAQIFVVDVGQHLVVGVGMHRGHQAVDDAELFMQRLDERRQAVGGARCVRDHRVAGFQHVVVDAVDDGRVDIVAAGGRDDHLLRAALQVGAGLFLGREKAGAFHHHVDAEFAPGQLGRVAVGQHANLVAVDDHVVALNRHGAGKTAVRGIVLRQVRIGLGIAEVVDRDDLDIVLLAALVQRT